MILALIDVPLRYGRVPGGNDLLSCTIASPVVLVKLAMSNPKSTFIRALPFGDNTIDAGLFAVTGLPEDPGALAPVVPGVCIGVLSLSAQAGGVGAGGGVSTVSITLRAPLLGVVGVVTGAGVVVVLNLSSSCVR